MGIPVSAELSLVSLSAISDNLNPDNRRLSMRLLLSAYACRPNAGSEPGCGWNWATHLAARGIEVHVLVAKRNQEAIEAGLRANATANLHFTYVSVPYE